MKLTSKILSANETERAAAHRLYLQAFPEEERIPWADLMLLKEEMPLRFVCYYDGETFVGFTIVYPREGLHWFWYFAVEEKLRGKGYGQQILSRLLEDYNDSPLILDIESPFQEADNAEQRRRRYDFYLRNGFRDTRVGRSFENISYIILMHGEGTFTTQNYDEILEDLKRFWWRTEISRNSKIVNDVI